MPMESRGRSLCEIKHPTNMKLSNTNNPPRENLHSAKLLFVIFPLISSLHLCQIQSLCNPLQFERANHPCDDKPRIMITTILITGKAILKLHIHEASAELEAVKGDASVLNMCK